MVRRSFPSSSRSVPRVRAPAAPALFGLLLAALPVSVLACALDEGGARMPPRVDDAGVDGATGAVTRVLSLEGPAGPRTLTFGERAELRIRYAERGGRPIAGATVTFAMVGVAHDSTLESTTARTDGAGVAVARLRAGTVATTFDLRATADHADALRVRISVGDAGFGDLRVRTRYEGERALARRVVSVYRARDCAEVPAIAVADREVSLGELDEMALLDALPAGAAYAVVARGESHDGVQLARGCQDGVEVVADAETPVDVAMRDVALTGAGTYHARLTLQTEDAARRAATTVRELETSRARSRAEARELLDALVAEVASFDTATAAALESSRDSGTLDASLARALDGAARPSALSQVADALEERLSSLALEGTLVLDARGVASPLGGLTLPVVLATGGDGAPELRLAFGGMELGPPVTAAIGLAALREKLVVLSAEIALPLGATSLAALEALARAEAADAGPDGGALGDYLARRSRCDAAVAWASAEPSVRGACDERCVRRACRVAGDVTAEALAAALAALDAPYARIWVSGEASAVDADGDAAVDLFGPSSLDGSWSARDGTGALALGASLACRRE